MESYLQFTRLWDASLCNDSCNLTTPLPIFLRNFVRFSSFRFRVKFTFFRLMFSDFNSVCPHTPERDGCRDVRRENKEWIFRFSSVPDRTRTSPAERARARGPDRKNAHSSRCGGGEVMIFNKKFRYCSEKKQKRGTPVTLTKWRAFFSGFFRHRLFR